MNETPPGPRADRTRARLRQAAIESFAKQGFHGTTTRDISTTAGVSPAALYVHYRSKEQLLYELALDGHNETLRIMRDSVSPSDEPIEALRKLVHAFATYHATAHTAARVVNHELAALSPEHFAEILELRREIENEVRAVITHGVESGQFDTADVQLTSASLVSLGVDLTRWYRDGLSWTPDDIGAHYAQLALRSVGVGLSL